MTDQPARPSVAPGDRDATLPLWKQFDALIEPLMKNCAHPNSGSVYEAMKILAWRVHKNAILTLSARAEVQPRCEVQNGNAVRAALKAAEAALSDIGDADREPGDDVAWCEKRAALALPQVRAALAPPATPAEPADECECVGAVIGSHNSSCPYSRPPTPAEPGKRKPNDPTWEGPNGDGDPAYMASSADRGSE